MVNTREIRTRGHSEHAFNSDAGKFYAAYWEDAPEISETTRVRNTTILDHFFSVHPKGKAILEIGVGGEGGFLYFLREDNSIQGLDVSVSAKRNCERLGIPVELHNLDTDPLPFPDEHFDIVFAFEVFEHLANPQFALEEVYRVLKQKGRFLLSIPNPLIHHWPRLFYPTLFEEKAFREFLMVNGFRERGRMYWGLNRYHEQFSAPAEKAFLWCWEWEKADDPEAYFQNGLYFWGQQNEAGIRSRPIEAADLFRKSLEKENGVSSKARFFLTLALAYRCIYGTVEEFMVHVQYFWEEAGGEDQFKKIRSIFALTLLNLEMDRLGLPFLAREIAVDLFQRLRQLPGSEPYLHALAQWGTESFDYNKIATLFDPLAGDRG